MTRDEAIEVLQNTSFFAPSMVDVDSAIEMAIRSLEAWDEVKHECWDEGHNFTGEYQGVWVRFKDIERIIDKHLKEVEDDKE